MPDQAARSTAIEDHTEVDDAAAHHRRLARGWLGRLRLAPKRARRTSYHGFISYSHATDGKLAPAVQTGLQRFAKPWYRTRALHIFRDDASLAANPNLWGSIRDALESSQHLILLASPRAAKSEWVAKEAQYWREHKSIDTILIGLTDGELIWQADGPGGPVTTGDADGDARDPLSALPASLDGAFAQEPRYIDLRWARNASDLSLSHPNWRDAIAELAAPLHGKPKDELASEEARQHRRTVRIVRWTGGVLVALTVAAIVAGLVAYSQYHSAEARALAAEATAGLGANPEHSLSLALQSTQINPSATGIEALRLALAQSPQRMAINSGAGAGVQAAWSPAGSQIAITGPHDQVQLWNSADGRLEHVISVPGGSRVGQLSYSRDGRWIVAATDAGGVYVWNASSLAPVNTTLLGSAIRAARTPGSVYPQSVTVGWGPPARDDLIVYSLGLNQVLAFAPSSGGVRELARLPQSTTGVDAASMSPDGSQLFVAAELSKAALLGGTGMIFSLTGGRPVSLTPNVDMSGHDACWFADSRAFVTWDPNEAQDLTLRWWNAASGRELSAFPSSGTITAAACSPSTTRDWVATGERGGTVLLRLANGTGTILSLSGHSQLITAIAGSPDGRYVATASDDGTARVWDTQSGAQLRVLNDGDAVTGVQFSPDGGLALTTDQQGMVRVWDTGVGEPVTRLALPATGETYRLGFTDHGKLVYGLNGVVKVDTTQTSRPSSLNSGSVLLWNSTTGAVVRRIPLPADVLAARAAAAVPCAKQGLNLEDCFLPAPDSLVVPFAAADGSGSGLAAIAISPTGSAVAYTDAAGVGILDPSGRVVDRLALPGRPTGLSFAGDKVIVMTDRAVYVWKPGSHARALALPQPSPTLDAEISRDGQRLVTADLDGTVTVWGLASSSPVAVFHVTHAFAPRVKQVSGGLESGPPVPLRVAINSNGSEVAAGTSWQTVFLWNVGARRVASTRFVAAPAETGTGVPGYNGPWPIAQLGFSANGSALVAVDFPYHAAGDSRAAATADVFSSNGALISSYQGPEVDGVIDPGAGLSPGGEALVAGALGLAPNSSSGYNAVYETASGDRLLNLQNAPVPGQASFESWPSVPQPWAPDGTHLLAGGGAIYACEACGSLGSLQQAARRRLRWLAPLSATRDTPPPGNPFG